MNKKSWWQDFVRFVKKSVKTAKSNVRFILGGRLYQGQAINRQRTDSIDTRPNALITFSINVREFEWTYLNINFHISKTKLFTVIDIQNKKIIWHKNEIIILFTVYFSTISYHLHIKKGIHKKDEMISTPRRFFTA